MRIPPFPDWNIRPTLSLVFGFAGFAKKVTPQQIPRQWVNRNKPENSLMKNDPKNQAIAWDATAWRKWQEMAGIWEFSGQGRELKVLG